MNARKVYRIADWPTADRDAWTRALSAGVLFEQAGTAAHWSEGSRRSVASGYGRWIGYLADSAPGLLERRPGERVTRDRVAIYVDLLQAQMTAAGVHNYVHHLQMAMTAMAPSCEWVWLAELGRRLAKNVVRRSKRNRIVPSDRIVDLGFKLMEQADGDGICTYRDGLVIALLALRPMRRRNLAMIRIGQHFQQTGMGFSFIFTAVETKAKRPFDFDMPDILVAAMHHYLQAIRPHFPGADAHAGLWASRNARPLSEAGLYEIICKRTSAAFGRRLSPHLFRDCAATTLAISAPDKIALSRDLLGHANLDTTQQHYNQARSIAASRRFNQTIASLKQQPGRS